jgi:hypothetical protein
MWQWQVAVWLGGSRWMRTSSRRPDPVSGCGRLWQMAVAVAGWQCVVWVGCVIASILIGDKVAIGAKMAVAVAVWQCGNVAVDGTCAASGSVAVAVWQCG